METNTQIRGGARCWRSKVSVVAVLVAGLLAGGVGAASAEAPVESAPLPLAGEAVDSSPPVYLGVSPARLMDTRSGKTTIDGQSQAQGPFVNTRELVVTGRGNVPSSGVGAVALNVTVVGPAAGGYTTVFPTGTARPNASNVNFNAGATVPNMAIVKVGTGGRVSVFNSATAHILVDVTGWFSASGEYRALAPARLTDTRANGATVDGQAKATGAFKDGRNLTVTGRGGVPASGVGAVVVNVTITAPAAGGFATVYPTGTARPNASNLNFTKGLTVANQVIVKVGSGGQITLFNSSSSHVIVDVVGWFPPNSQYTALNPARIMDSRPSGVTADGQAKNLGMVWNVTLPVAGRGGVPASGVGAVVLNVTTTGSAAGRGHYVTGFPTGEARPNASNLNFDGGQTVANLVIAKVGSGGQVGLFSSASTHLVVDVLGWFPSAVPVASDKFVSISAGALHTCALTESGGARCWGSNKHGNLGIGAGPDRSTPVTPTGLGSGVKQVAAEGEGSCALMVTGVVRCWGQRIDGTKLVPTDVPELGTDLVSISAGWDHLCGVTTSGGVKCWGGNYYGQLGVGNTQPRSAAAVPTGMASGVKQVAAGGGVTCAVLTTGAVRCWGLGDWGGVGDGSYVVRSSPVAVQGHSSGVASVAGGENASCSVSTAGALRCWGAARTIGDGSSVRSSTPKAVTGFGNGTAASVSTGGYNSCAVTGTGALRCWGLNQVGQLGDGSTTGRLVPVGVFGLSFGVAQVDVGGAHTCALSADGTAQCWGRNREGQLGHGDTVASTTPLDVVFP